MIDHVSPLKADAKQTQSMNLVTVDISPRELNIGHALFNEQILFYDISGFSEYQAWSYPKPEAPHRRQQVDVAVQILACW